MRFLLISMILFSFGVSSTNDTLHLKRADKVLEKHLSPSFSLMQDNFYTPVKKSTDGTILDKTDRIDAITFWIVLTIIILMIIRILL